MSTVPVEARPAISVVVPTFNRAPMLERLLEALSVCEMPSGGVEVIVVDDGSSDDTPGVVGRARVAGLRYLRQDNAGAAAARNRGWRHASGEVVVFTDDDCVPTREWLVELVGAMNDLGCDGAGGRIVPLVPGIVAGFVQAERLVGHGGDSTGVRYVVTANAAFRREALYEVGGFDERFPGAAGEDTDLTMRLAETGHSLVLVDGAVIAHDHRTNLRGLMRTYRRHGSARHLLRRMHPDAGVGAKAAHMVTPAYWQGRYVYYRVEGASRRVALVYCGLRIVCLVSYAAGMVAAARRARASARP